MNHWICGVRENDPDQYKHQALDPDSDAAVQMIGVYQGQCVLLLQTVADGDCGIDVCTMILGWERTKLNRDKVRCILCNFASKNRANRALIWLMPSRGEIRDHMGPYTLNISFCDLLDDGDGFVEVNHHGSGVPAVPQTGECPAREVTGEEFEAFKWTCSLQKMPAPIIKDMALRLNGDVLAHIVKQYNGREAAAPEQKSKAIHSRERLHSGSQEGGRRGFLCMAGGQDWRRHECSHPQGERPYPLWNIRGLCTKSPSAP